MLLLFIWRYTTSTTEDHARFYDGSQAAHPPSGVSARVLAGERQIERKGWGGRRCGRELRVAQSCAQIYTAENAFVHNSA